MSATDRTAPRRTLEQKLGYGLGSVYSMRRADGSLSYWHVYSDNGKQREVVLNATTLSAARKECSARNTRKDEGRLVAPTSITFAQVAEEYLGMQRGLLEEGRRSPRTIELYEMQYTRHLEPALGRKRFQQITANQLSAFLAELRGKRGVKGKMSANTRNGILRLASSIFSFGVSRGYRADSPVQYLAPQERPGAKARHKARVLTDDECSTLVSYCRPGLRDFVALLAFTGVRLSEGLGLRWADVDLEDGTITVTAQLERWRRGETPKRKTLKSENGYRTIDLHPAIVSVLRERRRDALAKGLHQAEAFVFCTVDGRPLSHRNTARDIEAAALKANLNSDDKRPVSAHVLRHTHCSRLISFGLDVVEVARQIGDRPETIMRVYAHTFASAKRRAETKQRISEGMQIAL